MPENVCYHVGSVELRRSLMQMRVAHVCISCGEILLEVTEQEIKETKSIYGSQADYNLFCSDAMASLRKLFRR